MSKKCCALSKSKFCPKCGSFVPKVLTFNNHKQKQNNLLLYLYLKYKKP